MKHNIELDISNKSSHWITPENNEKFSVEVSPIEVVELDTLVEKILAEFRQTHNDLIPKMRSMLTEWLQDMSDDDLELVSSEKVRDFIYEMF